VLDTKGSPAPVERVLIAPPGSRIGPLLAEERLEVMARSPYKNIYSQAVDRESAYEILKGRVAQLEQQQAQQAQTAEQQKIQAQLAKEQERLLKEQQKQQERIQREQQQAQERMAREQERAAAKRSATVDAFAKSAARAVGSSLGRQIVRGILGSLLGGRR